MIAGESKVLRWHRHSLVVNLKNNLSTLSSNPMVIGTEREKIKIWAT